KGFYTIIKACDEYIRFVLLTGVSKFSKAGVFSGLNNLKNLSMGMRVVPTKQCRFGNTALFYFVNT
ncbi:MAG: AAA family ATPase, partial [Deltaproteobacteria bacterium]|nr:AAA family ATPase [Deltaproteobacteria bacterium]